MNQGSFVRNEEWNPNLVQSSEDVIKAIPFLEGLRYDSVQ